MAVKDFIVAIELGSSKITGIAGKKLTDGSIQILAMASESSSDFIRKGVIYNLDKTTQSLTSIIKKLESTLKASIGKVYVGIAGQSLRTTRNTEVRHLGVETKISQELIDSLKDSNRVVPIVGYQILGVAPQEYKVGLDLTIDPVGVQTDHIEARFLNIIARNSVKQNIDRCFEPVTIAIADDADDLIAPLALADAILTPTEKRSGCVLVDFGADTTTVSIYKNNILRHLAVIPLGGSNITKDICSLQIEEGEAEALKIRFGCAYTEPSEKQEDQKQYTLNNQCRIEAQLLEDIVEARINEILDNVSNQIILSGYESKLLAGAILTGGGANLKNMEEAFVKRTKIEKVRFAKETQYHLKGMEIAQNGTFNTIIAILAAGKENCCLPIPENLITETASSRNIIEGQLFNEEGESMADIQKQKELMRQMAKEAALAADKAEKEKIEQERKRKVECDELINKADKLKEEKQYKEALKVLEKARQMNISEKSDEIDNLTKKIKALKEQNSWGKKFNEFVKNILDEE